MKSKTTQQVLNYFKDGLEGKTAISLLFLEEILEFGIRVERNVTIAKILNLINKYSTVDAEDNEYVPDSLALEKGIIKLKAHKPRYASKKLLKKIFGG